jgi:DNA-3-methyladenine glycosylase II
MPDPIRYLKRADPALARVIARVRERPPGPRAEGTHFDAILRAIVYQQLSGKAAGTIHGRILALYGGRAPTPDELLATPEDSLRAAGLSRQKLTYLRDLAQHASTGEVPFDSLHELDDDAIIAALTRVKGVGRWTVQMFLMFRLGRPDVLPELDLGIQNAIQRLYGLRERPKPKDVQALGARWRPFASHACWYLWRSLELPQKTDGTARKNASGTAQRTAKSARKATSSARGRAAAKKTPPRKPKRDATKVTVRTAKSRTRKTVAGKRGR